MRQSRYSAGDGTIDRARDLRRNATPAEKALWAALRGSTLDGFKFRRQQRLGPFFGDFVCQSARLVIEVDGETHAGEQAIRKDARRTAYLEHEGYRVLRFTNHDVMTNLDGVAEAIRAALTLPPPSAAGPSLSPIGEREK